MWLIAAIAVASGTACRSPASPEQVADPTFVPTVQHPAYGPTTGPRVGIDEGHHEFHTAGGRYRPFAELLRADGFLVAPVAAKLSPDALGPLRILVIANAACAPGEPSAFADDEIAALHDWIASGGSLLLIADHAPAPGAIRSLARAFGVEFSDGVALRGPDPTRSPHVTMFTTKDGSLASHAITRGRTPDEAVTGVATFTGSAFRSQSNVQPLLVLEPGTFSFLPARPMALSADTPRIPVDGWLQGAVLTLGEGRVAVFGEAGMFSAQRSIRGEPMGMNAPVARENAQFTLNVLHWLSGLL